MSQGKTASPGSNVRNRLLRTALGLFTTKGYAATTVREITAAAGVTKPVLYYYFGNKEGIYLELVRGILGAFTSVEEKYSDGATPAADRIRGYLTDLFVLSREHLDVIRLIHAMFFGPPQGAPYFDFDTIHVRIHDFIRRAVADGIARGEFQGGHAEETSWAIVGVFMAAVDEQLCHDHPQIDRDGLLRVIRLLLQWMVHDHKGEKTP